MEVVEEKAVPNTFHENAAKWGIVCGITVMLAIDELNPVKVLCSYARWCDGIWKLCVGCVREGSVGALAALWLAVLVIHERERILYYLVKLFFRCTFNNMFFRSVEIVGMENMPKHGPVILTGNHNNQFVDGLLLATNCDRQISFMIAQKSFDRPVVGFFAKVMHCLPVTRPQDIVYTGVGTVMDVKGGKITGKGTKFTEVQVGAILDVKGVGKLKIKEVVSETELVLDGDAPAKMDIPASGATFKVTPKLDQTSMFDRVFQGLSKGKCLGIFPEGGSHDRTDLLPLKAGVALIALDAYSKHHMTVPIVPVGLNYFQGHRFGGRVVVEFGPPLVVPDEIYTQHETDKRGATDALLQLVTTAMRSVIVPTPDYHTLQQIYTVRRLYVPDGLKLSAEQTMDLNRRFAIGIQRMLDLRKASEAIESGKADKDTPGLEEAQKLKPQDRAAIDGFQREVEDYMALLKRHGIRDHQVRQIGWWGFSDLISRLVYLIMAMALGIVPQVLFNFPIMAIASRFAAKEQQKALKASSVKIKALDVVMSYKVISVLVLIPVTYFFYISLMILFTTWSWTTVFIMCLFFPAVSFAGMKANEQGVRVYTDIIPLLKRLSSESRKEQDTLPARRAQLQKKLNQAIKKYGPLLGDLYAVKDVDWAKEMGWFSKMMDRAPADDGVEQRKRLFAVPPEDQEDKKDA